MRSLKTLVSSETSLPYDGRQLSPHWIYQQFNVLGDAVVAFAGPADVTLEHMVDLEDVRKIAPIYSPHMLHFIGEWFIDSLDQGVLLQHLFVAEIYESLWERGISDLSRRGNDIYFQSRKFSVSICTRSPVSVLMHTGINIDTEGTPIPTSGLREMNCEPFEFAKQVLERFETDSCIWQAARVKVLPR
jgi:uncharacterized protein